MIYSTKKVGSLGLMAFMLALSACNYFNERKLQGVWQAAEVSEDSTKIEVDLTKVVLKIEPEKRYYYHGTLNYEEAGTYKFRDNLLYIKDTTQNNSGEKIMEVLLLSDDSLFLKMEENQKPRILKLVKQK